MWAGCWGIVRLSNAQLDAWHARGVGGFACEIQHLAGLGGTQDFSADPNATLVGSRYDLQRQIRDSDIVARAGRRGIKLWIAIYLSNYYNHATPLEEWFDDADWSTRLLPKLGDLAGAARMFGFAGLAFDEEPYDGASWTWNYRTNTHTQAEVRAEVRARGAQMMRTIVTAFPGVDLLDYGTYFPESWNALVQQQVNRKRNAYADFVQINFWDGLTSVPAYGRIRFMDATFYKTWHIRGGSWDAALSYNVNRLMAYFSRHLARWSYASTRIDVSPFAWIDGDVKNEGAFTAPRPPAYVTQQLAAFRRWAMGGAFSIYSYASLGQFDYSRYAVGMKEASAGGTIDDARPKIVVKSVKPSARSVFISGSATDDTAIRAVTWHTRTAHGAARMTWTVTGGDYYTGYRWRMDWTASIPATSGSTSLTAYDVAGAAATATVA